MSCRCACTHSGAARARVPLRPHGDSGCRSVARVCALEVVVVSGVPQVPTSTHAYPSSTESLRGRQEFVCSRPSYVFPEYLMQYQCVSDSIPPLQLCCDALPPAALRIRMRASPARIGPPRKSDRSAPLRLAPLCFAFRTVSHDCIVAFRTVQYFCADGHCRYLRPSRSGVFGASPTVSGMAQQDSTKAAVRRPSAAVLSVYSSAYPRGSLCLARMSVECVQCSQTSCRAGNRVQAAARGRAHAAAERSKGARPPTRLRLRGSEMQSPAAVPIPSHAALRCARFHICDEFCEKPLCCCISTAAPSDLAVASQAATDALETFAQRYGAPMLSLSVDSKRWAQRTGSLRCLSDYVTRSAVRAPAGTDMLATVARTEGKD